MGRFPDSCKKFDMKKKLSRKVAASKMCRSINAVREPNVVGRDSRLFLSITKDFRAVSEPNSVGRDTILLSPRREQIKRWKVIIICSRQMFKDLNEVRELNSAGRDRMLLEESFQAKE